MKKLLVVIFAWSFALCSCNNEQRTNDTEPGLAQIVPKDEFAKLRTFMEKFDEPSQTFKAPSDQLIKVKGKQGTIIHLNPADLETEDGQPIGKEVVIELKELSNRQQLVRANAQTVSDGQLLVSGGACYIGVTSGGQKVKLKDGKDYSISFPKLSVGEMTLYYGQRDSIDKMNWIEAPQKFVIQKYGGDSLNTYEALVITGKDTLRKTTKVNISEKEYRELLEQSKLNEKVYCPVALKQFGWINCDRSYDKSKPITNIHFDVSNKVEEVNFMRVTLIFNAARSIMQSSYYTYDNKIEGNTFNNIPVGESVRFLAVSYQHEKIFATLTENISVKEDHQQQLTLKELSENEFDMLIKGVE
ncbi:MAG: hypothetical protein ABI763_02200 [Bacteroidota bacterium]